MKIAVLGSGNGGCAIAFDCAHHGYTVNLFDFESFPATIAEVQKHEGIYCEGQLQGFASVAYAGHDIEKALNDVDLIYAVGPAYSTRPFAKACKPHLKPNHMVIVCPSSCGGAIEFKKAAGLDLVSTEPLVAETSTLPYAVRICGPAKINVYLKLKGGLYLAALPASESQRAIRALNHVYPAMQMAKNVMQTSLQNGNPVIHPTVTLLNTALIERTGNKMLFYEEGVTESVGRLMKAVDKERIAIGNALGVDVLPDPELAIAQGYATEATYDRGYSEAPGFQGIKAQSSLNNRYFHEDVGYGLVFLRDLARQVGIKTPVIDSIIIIVSKVMDRDYLTEASRTMASLGLATMSVAELSKL
ncbi:Opine dehydrogenase [Gracilariopsis chorda]|uniref:Opine dehydrogenase n=1 Tax=Gracilariopsis chorda TaxID=448386 RepID=A0A2V3IP77_9FLOR|nr:Opine dehydrogenase [Gracilariopsis chorda]|eukprot:PXF43857.1 Opine dehydrogenase [Gracilariopsis chorda]